ncbi:MAG: A/G-specific adenine glycosylase [Bacteroidetes bacterium]|nr:A/G-specific adenine glycosylase [Bacteroidota bacterium]
MKQENIFRKLLMAWHKDENTRAMPWKGVKDPYKVWLSEIILQQTRVDQGWSYYEKFIQHYPTINHLAKADDEDVFKIWEGLGYYTRCKNLMQTARNISHNYHGIFPSDYDSILNLKGVGAYTASAIASFCFNLPYAVLDGNVQRVLSRFFGVSIPVDSNEGKKYFIKLAQLCLDKKQPGDYNQSIMDFGATVCKPIPLCSHCPLNKHCTAYISNKAAFYPVKEKAIIKRERWFSYFIFTFNKKIYVQQRRGKDIWQHLYEFYLEETSSDPAWNEKKIKQWLQQKINISEYKKLSLTIAQKQVLTHRIIHGYFIKVDLKKKPLSLNNTSGAWLGPIEIKTKAFPRLIHQFLSAANLKH